MTDNFLHYNELNDCRHCSHCCSFGEKCYCRKSDELLNRMFWGKVNSIVYCPESSTVHDGYEKNDG